MLRTYIFDGISHNPLCLLQCQSRGETAVLGRGLQTEKSGCEKEKNMKRPAEASEQWNLRLNIRIIISRRSEINSWLPKGVKLSNGYLSEK